MAWKHSFVAYYPSIHLNLKDSVIDEGDSKKVFSAIHLELKKQVALVIPGVNLTICDDDSHWKFHVPKTLLAGDKNDVSYFLSQVSTID